MKSISTTPLTGPYRDLAGRANENIEQNDSSGPASMVNALPTTDTDTRLILEATSSMVAIFDDNARYVYVSPSHKKALGYSQQELQGTTGFNLVHPDDLDRLTVLFAKGLSGEIDKIKPLTYRVFHKNGQIRYIQSTFDIIRDVDGNVEKFIAVGDDITDRMEIESALAESEQRLWAIMDTIPTAICEIDRQGNFQFVNRAYSRLFEYSMQELTSMNVSDVTETPQEGEKLLALLEQLAADQPPPSPKEARNRTRSGKILDVIVDWNYKKDDTGRVTGFITAISDVTERKKTSAALHQTRQRYQAMFNNISAGVAVYQPVDNGRDFIFLDFNKTAEQIDNISRDSVIGRKVSEVFPGIKSFGLFDVLQRVNETGRPEQVPISLYRDERVSSWRRNYVYKLPSGEVVAVYIDETDRVRAEEALRESEARFRSLVEYSSDHIFMLNSEGKYLFSNDRREQHDFTKKVSLIGKSLKDVHPPELAVRFQRLVAHVFKHGNVTSFEHEEKGPGGPSVHLNTLYPIYKDGKPWAVGGISREITTRKRYEQELQQKTRELEQTVHELRQTQRRIIDQERQRALSQMASGIAHDFNNSLTSIQGFSDLLLQIPEKMNDPKTVRDYVTLINNSAKAAAQIVRRLRKFYRPSENEKIEAVEMNRLIEEAIALTEPVWKSNAQARGAFITIEKQLEPDAVVSGNRTELHEVITNLIFNAVDAMPEGGLIRFITRRDDERIILEICDTGLGMEPDVLRQCLNPFYTTKGESGSGLGLATVQGIMTRHQGQIDIRSQPGRGTAFILKLPVSVPETQPAAGDETGQQTTPALKILVVDDEAHQRLLLKNYLQKDNHLTETAVNGVEGMRKFNDGWFDLVITDQAMPELNGDDLARNIKKTTPDKPVIMLTGFGDMMEATGNASDAIDLILPKPVTLEQLRGAIRQVMSDNNSTTGEK